MEKNFISYTTIVPLLDTKSMQPVIVMREKQWHNDNVVFPHDDGDSK